MKVEEWALRVLAQVQVQVQAPVLESPLVFLGLLKKKTSAVWGA